MTEQSRFYEPVAPEERLRRGDIALVYLPQTRIAGEPEPPLPAPSSRVGVPAYPGCFALPDSARMPAAQVWVWPALAVVVMDSCELDRYFNLGRSERFWDSRVAVAPVIFETHFPSGPWRRMAQGDTPLYGFYLEPLPKEVDGLTSWPRALVDLRGTTLVSRRHVQLNRRLRFTDEVTETFAVRVLEFWYLREVAREDQLRARQGKMVRDIVPVHLAEDYAVLRVTFEGADPLLVACMPAATPGERR